MPNKRLAIVGVMGSGHDGHEDRATPLGRWLAEEGVHVLTGGGGGVMSAVSKAFAEVTLRKGLVLGIIPRTGTGPDSKARDGYPNPWVEVPIFTHLHLSGKGGTEPLSRNHINVLSSDVVIALPGSSGTSSEVGLALTYARPIVAFLGDRHDIPGLPDEVPIESRLEGVQAFVRAQLSRAANAAEK